MTIRQQSGSAWASSLRQPANPYFPSEVTYAAFNPTQLNPLSPPVRFGWWGAGPGDPELLTLRALRVIEQADLILFDQLVSEEIRGLFPKQVPQFYVGKSKGQHSIPQHNLNALLVKKARQGLQVVRVKAVTHLCFGAVAKSY